MNKLNKTLDVSEFSDGQIQNMLVAGKLDPATFAQVINDANVVTEAKRKIEVAIAIVNLVVKRLEEAHPMYPPSHWADEIRKIPKHYGIEIKS